MVKLENSQAGRLGALVGAAIVVLGLLVLFPGSATDAAAPTGQNLSIGARSDGSSKASGTSYSRVRDGKMTSYWAPSGATGRISIKWATYTTVSAVVIHEHESAIGSIGDWELVDHETKDVLASGTGAGLITFEPVSLKKLNFEIRSSNGSPRVAEYETYATYSSAPTATTTVAPTTTLAPTTTVAATTTLAPATTVAATTTLAPATTVAPTTALAPTTTLAPATTVAPTTTASAELQGPNLSIGARSDGSSKGEGTSYSRVRDGNLSSYWAPSGSTGRISIKWATPTTVSSVIIREHSSAIGNIGNWELVDHSTGRVLASGNGAGTINFVPATVSKLNFVILSSSGTPRIAEYETYAGSSGNLPTTTTAPPTTTVTTTIPPAITTTAAPPATTIPPATTTTIAPTLDLFASCVGGSVDVLVSRGGSGWVAKTATGTIATGDFVATVQAALDAGLRQIAVEGNAVMSANDRISMRSNRTIAFCGTIDVTGTGSGDKAPVYARDVSNIEVSRLHLTGAPQYGIFMRNVSDVVLGDIDMRLNSGLGVRIDNHGDRSAKSKNISIDRVYVSGTSKHGVETYGVDGLTIRTVVARDTGYSGLILNDTVNADVGTVDSVNAGSGTGYAAMRFANRNGRLTSSYPTNIRVGRVIASGGGRGVFCVSESGGVVIDRIDISNTERHAILIENCYNVTINGGDVDGGEEIRLASRTEFAINRDITIRNVRVVDTNIRESPCGGTGINITNNTMVNGSINDC